MMKVKPSKPDRGKIDLSDKVALRAWTRKLGCSESEIAAAIEKVGDNAETVAKELGVKTPRSP